ncbi:Uncharacterised protein g9634 [Pycnogonum litorale]
MMSGTEETTNRNRYRTVTAEPMLFIFSLSVLINSSTNAKLILTKTCYDKYEDLEYCMNSTNPDIGDDDYVQKHSSRWILYMNLASFIPGMLIAIYAGSWGDKFGRKFPLLIPPIGQCLTCVSLALASRYIKSVPIWTFVLSIIPSGLSGGELVVISGCFSYVVNICKPEDRIRRLSVLQAMIQFASAIGPLICLGILSVSSNFVVYCTTSGLALISLLYACFVLQRVDPVGGAEPINFKSLFEIQHVVEGLTVIFKKRDGDGRKSILILFFIFIIYFFMYYGTVTILYLYVKDKPLSWTFTEYIILLSTANAVLGTMALIILPLIRSFVSFRDTTLGIISLGVGTVALVIMGFAETRTSVYIAKCLFSVAVLTIISCRAVLSNLVETNEQGKVFSLNAAVENISFMSSTAIFNGLWPITRQFFKGTLYEILSAVAFFAFLMMIYLHLKLEKRVIGTSPKEHINKITV